MVNSEKVITQLNLTNELLFRLCVGQRLLSFRECIEIRELIPRMSDHPCTLCQANCVEQEKQLTQIKVSS
jgi:hypothetical protein